MFFPPTQIFGKNLVAVYYINEEAAIPLADVTRSLGAEFKAAFDIVKANRETIKIFDAATGKSVPLKKPLGPLQKRICLGMDGIFLLIIAIDHSRIRDPETKERIVVAKQWLIAQVSNRLKLYGRKNQPRWDAGLTKEQAKAFKKQFAKLGALTKHTASPKTTKHK
jgi:hypothetical protein